jgi:hypothetical protein
MQDKGFVRLFGEMINGDCSNWYQQISTIDALLPSLGLELAQEEIYIQWGNFSKKDSFYLARPIISPPKIFSRPFKQVDFKYSLKAYLEIKSSDWESAFLEVEDWLKTQAKDIESEVTFLLQRGSHQDLELKIRVYLN